MTLVCGPNEKLNCGALQLGPKYTPPFTLIGPAYPPTLTRGEVRGRMTSRASMASCGVLRVCMVGCVGRRCVQQQQQRQRLLDGRGSGTLPTHQEEEGGEEREIDGAGRTRIGRT